MEPTQAGASELAIRHEEQGGAGSFFVEQGGRRLAELTYARASPQSAVLQHTEVSKELGGRGVGKKLVEAAVEWARRTGTRFTVECSYAKTVFDRNAGLRDVLA